MYVVLLTACLTFEDPKVADCTNLTSTGFFSTYEKCIEDAVMVGQPFVESQGRYLMEINCVPVALFGDSDV